MNVSTLLNKAIGAAKKAEAILDVATMAETEGAATMATAYERLSNHYIGLIRAVDPESKIYTQGPW